MHFISFRLFLLSKSATFYCRLVPIFPMRLIPNEGQKILTYLAIVQCTWKTYVLRSTRGVYSLAISVLLCLKPVAATGYHKSLILFALQYVLKKKKFFSILNQMKSV